jgi:hypothetical protein
MEIVDFIFTSQNFTMHNMQSDSVVQFLTFKRLKGNAPDLWFVNCGHHPCDICS